MSERRHHVEQNPVMLLLTKTSSVVYGAIMFPSCLCMCCCCATFSTFLSLSLLTGLVDEFPGKAPDDGKPMLTLTYSDGPGFDVHHMKNGAEVPRMNLSGSDTSEWPG